MLNNPSDPTPMFLNQYQTHGHAGATSSDMFGGLFQVQRAITTLDVNGEATWTFPAAYAVKPVINHIYEETADNLPIIIKVKGFTVVSTSYTAVTIKGYRFQALPASLVLLTSLQWFSVSAGTAPSGIAVHLTAAIPG